jgi:hypothetical protein
MTPQEIQEQFIEKFREIENVNGFHAFTPYTDGNIGFSVRKDLNPHDDQHTSLLSLYLRNQPGQPEERKPLIVDANYVTRNGEELSYKEEEKTKISSPGDLTSGDDHYYDITHNIVLSKTKELSPTALINEVYEQHIKPTKLFQGFWLRIKLFFFRIVLVKMFEFLSSLFQWLLFIITGDRYSYAPILGKEVFNNTIVSHRFKELIGHTDKRDKIPNEKKTVKFEFLGYEGSYWTIIVYCALNLVLYLFFEYTNWKPYIIVTLVKNSFLTLVYVIVSLSFLELVVPKILKRFIKYASMLSFWSTSKSIRI